MFQLDKLCVFVLLFDPVQCFQALCWQVTQINRLHHVVPWQRYTKFLPLPQSHSEMVLTSHSLLPFCSFSIVLKSLTFTFSSFHFDASSVGQTVVPLTGLAVAHILPLSHAFPKHNTMIL
uniref:Secreted protein n=1 Tax=Mola mola TaxID=94237 RepID=A0A3Q4AZ28_MOLML